jgi:hypothetical protein
MTGDTPQESGHTSGAESAEIQNPDPDDSPGYGTAAGEEKTVVADSGTASAWPPWLGAARPAGWFLSASGEAAPPETPGTEPARADAAQSADLSPADQPGRAGASERAGVFAPTGPSKLTGVPERDEPDPDGPGQPSADGWAEYSPARDEPAERAGRDDAAAPYAVADSGPDDGWYEDPQPTSVHQIPQRWSWQPEPLPEPWQDAPRAAPPRAGDWYEPGCEARQDAQGYEPQRAGTSQQAWQDEPAGEPRGPAFGQPRAYGMPPREPRFVPVVGPTAALRGQAGGPGFVVPPGAVSGLYDPARRSGWQLAAGVWGESGIGWEPPVAEPLPGPGWSEYGRSGGPHSQSLAADDYRQDGEPPRGGPGFAGAPAFSAAPAFAGAANFAAAPTFADAPAAAHPSAPPLPGQWRDDESKDGPGEPDELYRAWQGSVRQAARAPRAPGPRMTAAGRRRAWQVVRVGVPAAVLVTVGAGALMMLTGKTNEMLASRGSQTTPDAGGSPAAFAGYPGQHGTVMVNSIAAAGGTRLAVGAADGHPAIWRRAADGSWTLISASSSAVSQRPGADSLLGVAHGPAGWIAVGAADSQGSQQPVVLTSADGATWQAVNSTAFTAPGISVMGVTASRSGYVVVGKQVSNGRTFAAMWWSGDLRNWTGGSNGGLDGRLKSSAVYAVGATATGFVAAGTHGGCHTIWTSADGKNWSVYDVPRPPGATDALLRQVAVNGTRVVTAGYVVDKAGDAPVVVVSADGGKTWRQILLSAPGGAGAVAALTAAGNGFVAAGVAGPAGAQHAVTWSSPDGITWSAATPVSAGQITALSAVGSTVSGAAQRGAGPSVVTFAAP